MCTLKYFTRYYWRVKVYNQNNEASSWSDNNWFETAMLATSEWKGYWISDGSKNSLKDEDYYKEERMPLFRKEFVANKKVLSARLYISEATVRHHLTAIFAKLDVSDRFELAIYAYQHGLAKPPA